MNLKESDLRKLLATSHEHVVVDFAASWCGPCRMFASTFEAVSKKGMGKTVFAKVDIDECTQLCEDLNITAVPTVILFRASKVVARHEGGFDTKVAFAGWLKTQRTANKK